jgi:hypothetical protein
MTTAQPVMPTSPRGEQYEDLFLKSSNKPFITNPSDIGPELTLLRHSKPKLGTFDHKLIYKLKWQLEITVQESQSGKEKPSGGVGMEDGEDYVRLYEALRNLSPDKLSAEKQELLSSDYIFQLYQAILLEGDSVRAFPIASKIAYDNRERVLPPELEACFSRIFRERGWSEYVGKVTIEDLYEQIKRLSKSEKRHIMRLMAKDSWLYLTAEDLYEQIESLPKSEKRHIMRLVAKEFGKLGGPPIQPRVTKRRRDLLYKVIIPEFGREYENNLSPKQVSRLVDTITPAMLRDCLEHYPDVCRYYEGLDDAALRALLFHDLKSIKTEPKRYL